MAKSDVNPLINHNSTTPDFTDKFPPVDLVVEAGIVPRLIELLARHDMPNLQLEAAWAITNIACTEVRHAHLLIRNGMSCSICCVYRCGSAVGITIKARRILLFAQYDFELFLTVINSLKKIKQFGMNYKKNRL